MKTTTDKFVEAFANALRKRRKSSSQEPLHLTPAAVKPAWTVAISRECGAGGTEVARSVGSRLDWPVYDRELLEQVAADVGVRTEVLEHLDEKHQSAFAEWLESLITGKMIGVPEFSHRLSATLSSLASHGQCVIVGRGAALVLPVATTLRVRLVAPLDVRIARVQVNAGITEHEAVRRVQETDVQRAEFVRAHFSKDVTDTHLFDLVLNTARLSTTQCADVIAAALHQLESGGAR